MLHTGNHCYQLALLPANTTANPQRESTHSALLCVQPLQVQCMCRVELSHVSESFLFFPPPLLHAKGLSCSMQSLLTVKPNSAHLWQPSAHICVLCGCTAAELGHSQQQQHHGHSAKQLEQSGPGQDSAFSFAVFDHRFHTRHLSWYLALAA